MFGRRITLFHLFGFAIRLDASWIVIAALVTWTLAAGFFPMTQPGLAASTYWWMGLAGALLLFGSIVVHELFHALVARRYGIPMRGITLFIFGGVAEMDAEPPSPKAEFRMAVAGPIASILIGAVFFAIARGAVGVIPAPALGVVEYIYWINWVLAAFNLIPAFPLDGGRMLRATLWRRRRDLRSATRTATRIGSGFAFVLMALAVLQLFAGNLVGAIWWFVLGLFLRAISQASYQQVLLREALHGEPVARFMNPEPDTVPSTLTIDDFVNDYLYRRHHRLYPVTLESDKLAGCVTTEQVKTVPRAEWQFHTVQEILRPCSPENTVSPETDSVDALALMNRSGNTKLMVVENNRLVGIVALRDLLKFISTKLELEGDRADEFRRAA